MNEEREEGEEGPQSQEQRFSCSLWRSMVEKVSTLQSSLCQSKWKLYRKLQPVKSPCWSKLQTVPIILWGTLQSIPEGLHPMVRTHDRAFFKELQLEGKIHAREVHEGLYPIRGIQWSRKRILRVVLLSRKEWQRQYMMN